MSITGMADHRARWRLASKPALALFAAVCLLAQSYKPGDPVEYKAQSFPEKWERGVYLRDVPGGTQVLIRQAPSQFFPEGFERAYSLADVRKAGLVPATPPAPARPAESPREPAPASAGPMSQQAVLAFLRDRLGPGDPFANPKRPDVLHALRLEVLRRGVDFRYQAVGDFSNRLGKYGALSNVTAALRENFGPPARIRDLHGKWRLMKVGATTTFVKGSDVYRRGEYAGDAGSVLVNADSTYVWDSPSGLLKGSWRAATPAELAASDKGGEGVVLLKSKSGGDWLLFARDEEGPEGRGVMLVDLITHSLRERGVR